MLEGKLIIIPALGHQSKGKSSFTGSGLFVLMSQCGNSNELALQHGGFFVPCDLLLQKAYYHIFGKRKPCHSNSLNSLYLLERRSLRSTGPFLERLGNSSGRKSNSWNYDPVAEKAALLICFRYKGRQNNCQLSKLKTCSYWRYKEIYITRKVSRRH